MSIDRIHNVMVVRPDARLRDDGVSDLREPKIEQVQASSNEGAKNQIAMKESSNGEPVVVFSLGTSTQVPEKVGYSPAPQFYGKGFQDERDPAVTPF